jgi:valyl-tRNA synthetase
MPFITETVWQRLPRRTGGAESIMVAAWPEPVGAWEDERAEAQLEELQEIIGAVRNIRSEYGVQPAQPLRLRVAGGSAALREALEGSRRVLSDLARVEPIGGDREPGEVGASVVLRSGAELFVPLADVIDLERERERLRQELTRVGGLFDGTRKRLENESFVSRAPAEVVERERDKLRNLEGQRDKLARTLRSLEGDARG